MSSYVKATNFATKDTLPQGDSNKIVKGTELDNEFNAIAGAVSSKADIASPSFTGTPAAPTATAGSNTTQIATTAYVKAEITAATGTLGTMSSQNANAVAITGGTVSGITGSINSVTPGTNSVGARTISTSAPSGGSNGDIWYKV
jgi:Tfp pilus assembly major pilin PilA